MIKLLIIEDHKILIEGIKELLDMEPTCGIQYEAYDGESGIELVKIHNDIDAILLDINLPDMSGFDVCKQIKSIKPKLPILTLTMHESHAYLKKMINAGTNGYILKNTSKNELVKAIISIVNGKQFFSEKVKEIITENRTLQSEHVSSRKEKAILTFREKEVLNYILKEYTTNEIAKEMKISHYTVNSHRKNLLKKLDVKNTAGLVKRAIEDNLLS